MFRYYRITDITSSVLVGQGEPAHLECAVDANPLNENTIRWERNGYDMASRTKTTTGSPTGSTMLSSLMSANSVNSLFGGSGQNNIGVVLLTVLNATAEDSGEFWCVASNGLGSRSSRNASFLLVRRKLHFMLDICMGPASGLIFILKYYGWSYVLEFYMKSHFKHHKKAILKEAKCVLRKQANENKDACKTCALSSDK